jgi:hypothetical protein
LTFGDDCGTLRQHTTIIIAKGSAKLENEKSTKRKLGPTGRRVRYGEQGRAKIIVTDGHRWSDESEALFLDHLAASCNVTLAANEVGFSRPALYQQRRNSLAFAEKWQAALEQGYANLEMELVRTANESLADVVIGSERPIPKMSVKEAIIILAQYRQVASNGAGRRPGWQPRVRSIEEVRDSITRKINAIEASIDQ